MNREDDTEKLANFRAGRMDPAEAEAFAKRLQNDPEAAAWSRLADGIAEAEAGGEPAPGAFGWARLSRSIESETVSPKTHGWHVPVWQAAAAVVLSIGLWQLAVQPLLTPDMEEPGYVTASGDGRNILRVDFADEATEDQIRSLLREFKVQIVEGPSALGLYSLSVPEGADLEDMAEALSARSDIIESATLP